LAAAESFLLPASEAQQADGNAAESHQRVGRSTQQTVKQTLLELLEVYEAVQGPGFLFEKK
jgi:hypothetical protein